MVRLVGAARDQIGSVVASTGEQCRDAHYKSPFGSGKTPVSSARQVHVVQNRIAFLLDLQIR